MAQHIGKTLAGFNAGGPMKEENMGGPQNEPGVGAYARIAAHMGHAHGIELEAFDVEQILAGESDHDSRTCSLVISEARTYGLKPA